MPPIKILQISPYPIKNCLHGGQIRVRNIQEKLGTFADVVFCAIYMSGQYEDSDSAIVVPQTSKFIDARFPYLADFFAAQHAARDEVTFHKLRASLDQVNADVIWIEQAWAWPVVKRWQATARCAPLICYSSHNIEHHLKAGLVGPRFTRPPDQHLEAGPILAEIENLERELIRSADIVIAVSSEDARLLRCMGAQQVVLAGNGVNSVVVDQQRMEDWRHHLEFKRYAMFVGSGHPPNAEGFWDWVGAKLGFLKPNELIMVAGGVSSLIREDARFVELGSLGHGRIHFGDIMPPRDLSALVAASAVMILPISSGGGTNLKTAEAIISGRPIVASRTALRGFEFASSLTNVVVADTATEFRRAIRHFLEIPDCALSEIPADEWELRKSVLWSECLRDITRERIDVGQVFDRAHVPCLT